MSIAVNGTSPKGNGAQRRPPCYSVETPYGFHLDLDFLKYVDDIEKGNTIRRVPIHRRHRVPNSTALSRNLSLPGYGYRPSQWSSIGSLWPKTRTIDSQQPYSFQGYEGMTVDNPELLGFTHGSLTNAEMEASIRAFDEQPLGLHVRPNLLRATSLPLTVLLRKHSETAEDPTSPRCSRIPQENGSTEDVFSDSSRVSTGTNGTIKRLTAALERIGELEEEIRVVPELKAQICILQEERERLLLKLNSNPNRSSKLEFSTGSNAHLQPDDWMSRELKHLEEKVQASSAQVNALSTPSLRDNAQTVMNHGITPKQCLKGQRDVLSVETLESRILSLEHKLHKSEQELDQTVTCLSTNFNPSSSGLISVCFFQGHIEEEPGTLWFYHFFCAADSQVQALTVVFQHWFHLAAEEDSSAQCVELYLKQVKATTPTLLYFLVNMVDDEGNTALHYSMSHGNFSVSQVLLDSGQTGRNRQLKDGYSPLLLAAVTGPESPEKQGVVLQLLSLGDVNARLAPAGQTALHLAVRRGREDMVRLLLSAGADCNAQDQSESTALMNACELGCCDIITALLERPDCDVTLTDRVSRHLKLQTVKRRPGKSHCGSGTKWL
uniref:Uncharacterized protein n=1 Tax=Denticeps clupeoides TaxID=299321 RepID=A0AAY4B0W7_9TELE